MTEPTPDYAGLNLIAEAITEWFGERCPDYAEGCYSCEAWKEYDRLRTLLERYEALERERDEARRQSDRFCDKYLAALSRAEAAEAKLAEAMKVIGDLLACPSIADEDHSDPEWGCEETADAERAAREFLKENGNGE